MFLFQFGCPRDRQRVLLYEPWHFNKHAIILGIPDGNGILRKENLQTIPFWVQIHRLPFLSITEEIAKHIPSVLGTSLEVDKESCRVGWVFIYGCVFPSILLSHFRAARSFESPGIQINSRLISFMENFLISVFNVVGLVMTICNAWSTWN